MNTTDAVKKAMNDLVVENFVYAKGYGSENVLAKHVNGLTLTEDGLTNFYAYYKESKNLESLNINPGPGYTGEGAVKNYIEAIREYGEWIPPKNDNTKLQLVIMYPTGMKAVVDKKGNRIIKSAKEIMMTDRYSRTPINYGPQASGGNK